MVDRAARKKWHCMRGKKTDQRMPPLDLVASCFANITRRIACRMESFTARIAGRVTRKGGMSDNRENRWEILESKKRIVVRSEVGCALS